MSNTPILDPITNKIYTYDIKTDAQKHLLDVLRLACRDECPPNKNDYLCVNPTRLGTESATCSRCMLRLASKVTVSTDEEKRLKMAIKMASQDKCPDDVKDKVCLATEDDSTDSDTCEKCLLRWATVPFGKFKERS